MPSCAPDRLGVEKLLFEASQRTAEGSELIGCVRCFLELLSHELSDALAQCRANLS